MMHRITTLHHFGAIRGAFQTNRTKYDDWTLAEHAGTGIAWSKVPVPWL